MRLVASVILASALGVLAAAPARAAIFMKYGDIMGDVTTEGFEGDIQLDNLTFSDGRSITAGIKDRDVGLASLTASVAGLSSSASVDLFSDALVGEGETVKIDLTETLKARVVTYAEWEFDDTLISGFSTSSDGFDYPEESYTLNFTKVTFTSVFLDADGNAIGTQSSRYDSVTNQVTTSSTGVPEPGTGLVVGLGVAAVLRREKTRNTKHKTGAPRA